MATPDKTATAPHLLVVIDHQEARVYRTRSTGPCRTHRPL